MDSNPAQDQQPQQQEQPQPQQEVQTPVFFPVSVKKLAIMSFFSFGVYEIWWAFKNWLYVKESLGQSIRPGWRAWFSIIFMYSLFKEIREFGQKHGVNESLQAGWLTTAWILLTFSSRLSDWCLFISLCSFLPLLRVQKQINRINLAMNPDCQINSKFTRGNWVLLVIGGILLVLDIVGMFIPNTPSS
jgi:hypothetical protein